MSHIALLIPSVDRIGGAERQTLQLAQGLVHRGWRVTLVALAGDGGAQRATIVHEGIGFVSLGMRKGLADPRGWLRYWRWLYAERPDLVHAHLAHAALLARWSRLFVPVRALVDTLHSAATGGLPRRIGYRLSRWLPDAVTAVSQAVALAHSASAMANKASLLVLPNGIDTCAWSPNPGIRQAARYELGRHHDFLWLAVGRLQPVKDYPTLLRAMTKVPDAQLILAGAGPLDAELKQLCASLGLSGRVRFLGFQHEVDRWMRAADGFVLTSLWEGLPLTLLEAGACALPAVATAVSGTSEVVINEQTGLLVPAQNPAAVAQAMNAVMALPTWERVAMGARARLHIEQNFGLDSILDRWEALYASLLERHRRPSRWA